MPVFKWTCCRRNVENQVDSQSRKSPTKSHDGAFESDMQAVQWMRDRSKQKSYDSVEQQKMSEEDGEEDDGVSSSIRKASPRSFPPRIPIDTDGIMDLQMALEETSTDGLKRDIQVPVSPSSDDIWEGGKGSSLSTKEDDTDSEVDISAKQQYEKAVELLHRAMLEKQTSLTSGESEFLHHLLDGEVNDATTNVVEERVEALQSAAQTLEKDDLFDVDAPPSPSLSPQQYSPPRRPEYRGVKLSVVKPALQSSASGEAFELMIRNSSSFEFDDMDIDDTPLLIIGT